MPKVSVILSFYNKIDYLDLVLAGFGIQSFKDFEIIIADDGSKPEVVSRLEFLMKQYNFEITHLWQEDKGFRKNRILNRAIEIAGSDYLVFVDADCIPHSKFVEEHYFNREEKTVLAGRRINLSEKITKNLSPEKIKHYYLERKFGFLLLDGLFGKSAYVEKGIYLRNKFLRKLANKKQRGLLGSNFSIHKKDFVEINGFDERYEAPSIGEDSDVQYRLELNGVRIKSLNNIAIQYHLYHKLLPRPQENLDLFKRVKSEKSPFTKFGIVKSEEE